MFDERPGMKEIQDFRRCVEETHASWLLDSGMFSRNQSPERRKRAEDEVRRMGYEFYVRAVTIGDLTAGKLLVKRRTGESRSGAVLLRLASRVWADQRRQGGENVEGNRQAYRAYCPATRAIMGDTLDLTGVSPGTYQLALRVPIHCPRESPFDLPTNPRMPMSPVG